MFEYTLGTPINLQTVKCHHAIPAMLCLSTMSGETHSVVKLFTSVNSSQLASIKRCIANYFLMPHLVFKLCELACFAAV